MVSGVVYASGDLYNTHPKVVDAMQVLPLGGGKKTIRLDMLHHIALNFFVFQHITMKITESFKFLYITSKYTVNQVVKKKKLDHDEGKDHGKC